MKLITWFFDGGPLMWPILLCSVIALAVALERFFTLRRAQINTRQFMATIRTVLEHNRVDDAVAICDENAGPIAHILKAGILKHDRPRAVIREAIENAGMLEVPRLERYLNVLATVANISPLIGLLGTVQGMIRCFWMIQSKMGVVNPSDLAEGIGNALITTAGGLLVAIPTLVLYNYYLSRVNGMVHEMEISSAELLDLLTGEEDER
jgi:biopolymer transport protein ExbB